MARDGRKPRKPSKKSVKAAADRAEKRSKGEEPVHEATPLKPGVVTEGSAVAGPLPGEATAPHPGGRPTEYDPKFCDSAAQAAARGATIYEIADLLGVHRATIHRWMAQHQEFCDSIKLGKEIADDRVGFSLYERAVGYSYNAVKIFCSEGSVTRAEYVEHVPPDVKAQALWLTNRKPKEWTDTSAARPYGSGSPVEAEVAGDIALARKVAFALGRAAERLAQQKEQAKIEAVDAEVVEGTP